MRCAHPNVVGTITSARKLVRLHSPFSLQQSWQLGGTYCFCGNELIADAALAPTSTTCNNPCGGNNRETCGGAWLIDIYTYTGTTATTAIASSSSTPTSSSGGSSNSNGNGNGNGNGNSNSNTQTVNVGKSSADSLLSPSKITISVTIPIVVLALAGFLWWGFLYLVLNCKNPH